RPDRERCRLGDAGVTAVVAGAFLRDNWLEHWPAFYARDCRLCRPCFAARVVVGADARRSMLRLWLFAGEVRRYRSTDGLPRHQPWRGRYGGDYRLVKPCRYGVCDGDADRALYCGVDHRADNFPLCGEAAGITARC